MQKGYLRLEIGPKTFQIFPSWRDKAFILSWVAETEAPNLIWIRLITIKWRWPPVVCVEAFTDAD